MFPHAIAFANALMFQCFTFCIHVFILSVLYEMKEEEKKRKTDKIVIS